MHPSIKSLLTPDFTRHPAEDDLVLLFAEAPGVDVELIQKARSMGVSWQAILDSLVQYSSAFPLALQAFLAALEAPTPAPPSESPGGPETAQETTPEESKPKRRKLNIRKVEPPAENPDAGYPTTYEDAPPA